MYIEIYLYSYSGNTLLQSISWCYNSATVYSGLIHTLLVVCH